MYAYIAVYTYMYRLYMYIAVQIAISFKVAKGRTGPSHSGYCKGPGL